MKYLAKTCLALHLLALLAAGSAPAAVLPDDRADILYHHYDGGGVTVDGPSVLVRKKVTDSVSLEANYYVDMISSASVDVLTRASPYKERREQKSLSADYLNGKSLYSLGYINSVEHDYTANTAYFNVSQEMFGDLTTVNLGFSRGWDKIGERGDPTFMQRADRRNYRVGVSQVLTRNLVLGLNFETTTDAGYLQNPYRAIRYLTGAPNFYAYGPEVLPNTRTGNAGSALLKYYLPWRAALEGQYRYYADTWGIRAHTGTIEYTQPAWVKWTFSARYRFYTQNAATFYSDLFPTANYQNFMSRDKEYAAYNTNTIGLGVSYEFGLGYAPWIKKGTLNLHYDRILINYKDFRDLVGYPPGAVMPGTESLYNSDADVFQLFVSFWF